MAAPLTGNDSGDTRMSRDDLFANPLSPWIYTLRENLGDTHRNRETTKLSAPEKASSEDVIGISLTIHMLSESDTRLEGRRRRVLP
ncbi:hypothetical protein CC2G_003012 [Coprinopsis cinerea AmutBmut pab1-1]|nr:hypothetical protein CC2G_003012 [Coprinopsis cinerea AmutBmut pab1-1]